MKKTTQNLKLEFNEKVDKVMNTQAELKMELKKSPSISTREVKPIPYKQNELNCR